MKKILYYTLISLAFITINSCEDHLDSVPFSFASPDNFYKSAEEVEIGLNGVYSILTAGSVQNFGNASGYRRGLMFMLNGATDEAVLTRNFNNITFSVWGNASFTSESTFINENWFFFYAGINRANILIDRLQNIDGFEENRKIEIEAEARVLRGFYHMILSMMHGGIPVYNTPLQDPNQERQSIATVYEQILSDFEFGYQNLQPRGPRESSINKYTAAGLLVKAHTYLASFKKTGSVSFQDLPINSFDWVDADSHYQKALDYTTEIINQSGYELITEYDNLFRETTKSFQYRECLFTAEASTDAAQNVITVLVNAFIPQGNRNINGGGFGWYRPTSELWNKYTNGDIRFKHNLTGNFSGPIGQEIVDGVNYYIPREIQSPNTGLLCIGKYRMVDPDEKVIAPWASGTTLPLLRFADILLLRAEAQYFLGDEAAGRNTLTTLRQRSSSQTASVQDLNAAYAKADFLTELLDERSRELCFENWRRIDLARFHKFDETIQNLSETEGFYNVTTVPVIKNNWRPERIWIPIPLQQRDLNQNLIQNNGY
tara:strand:+ start:16889 stop:18523 length:1635 start_codon:yes stop_codon:yes gene_type:complete